MAGRLSSLRTKLVVPYLTLSLATAMVGIFVVTRLVTSSLRERFANQMLEASRVAADSIVRLERVHLEQLRMMAFTQGVSQALASQDANTLRELLYPLALNADIHTISAINGNGQEILSLVQDPVTGDYVTSHGADLSGLNLVSEPLAGHGDAVGDKYAGVAETIYGPLLLTTAPVRTGDGVLVGVLMIGTRLEALLAEIKSQALADVILLDPEGSMLATTLAEPESGYEILGLPGLGEGDLDPGVTRELILAQRRYQGYYTRFLVRDEIVGVLAVVLPSNFIIGAESTSRNLLSLVFGAGSAAIIGVGYLLAHHIARPILRIRDVSLAVASGDLDQRTGVHSRDEIGQLAAVFDLMTFRLRRRTAQAARLQAETAERNQQLGEANTRLQIAQQQLIQSEKLAAVGQLTAGIVHDVKNPLGVIRGLSEEIQEMEQDPAIASQVRLILEHASRANTIVSDLLKFARQSLPSMRHQNIIETVQSALRLTDFLARRGKVKVVYEWDSESVMATYDAQQIEQVLVNLIQNAIQAMPDGGTLRVCVAHTAGWVQILVQDTGVGISPAHLARIFDPFFTTKSESEGTGLGLSVSYGIVTQHKGQIEVKSVVGRGTAFQLRLPRGAGPNGRGS
jgi:two-component system NtrC family sensor kinase